MNGARVLIVEDNLTIAGNLYEYLQTQGFMPDAAYEGKSALAMLERQEFDAVLLDVGLPGGLDGYGVLHHLRTALRKPVPVLILTARDGLDDKLAGFSHGADDYLTKPFALAEVKARLLALIQRSRHAVVDAVYRFGPLAMDSRSREVSVNGKPVHLARKSVLIVEMLLRDPGKVVSRETLEAALWGDEPPASDALRSQVHLLRRALSEAGFDGIETTHGIGWRLVQKA
ncbi:response regulator transcription factor [Bordetella avium]|uniref:Two-component system response regulator n=1 Tax=Bordetella avium (strain 197N) TaxID=360910 RepID=Q2KYD8_BORA1|nr:response regulator transcription factor [Bordetella avium]AZY48089.1 DNA-binding response regulator [Bordetella avium]AZY51471.1 DNA-binding response regulator [Bordetella avium]RIQ14672.1 DNA-binding response regulator [Bordetella avium]RIQ16785.1 DNA-binding response regulator [Bordetella avium]RIQ35119.1 DNA-binding response regulator [Bordetella avium]